MKIFTYVAVAIALALIVFNLFQIDYSNPFEGNSTIAIIGVVAGICAILLLGPLSYAAYAYGRLARSARKRVTSCALRFGVRTWVA